MIRYLALWVLLALLSGCGHKGPLYLPPAKTSAKPVSGTQVQTPAVPPKTSAPAAP